MRFRDRRIFLNKEELYSEHFKNRNVNSVKHYSTPKMRQASSSQIKNLNLVRHTWKVGDKFYKLASEHYDDPKLWWAIAWFNRTPTEAHIKIGEMIFIPTPIAEVLKIYEVYY